MGTSLYGTVYYLGQGWAKYGLQAKSSLTPVFVNYVLSEHRHSHLFTHYLWQL